MVTSPLRCPHCGRLIPPKRGRPPPQAYYLLSSLLQGEGTVGHMLDRLGWSRDRYCSAYRAVLKAEGRDLVVSRSAPRQPGSRGRPPRAYRLTARGQAYLLARDTGAR